MTPRIGLNWFWASLDAKWPKTGLAKVGLFRILTDRCVQFVEVINHLFGSQNASHPVSLYVFSESDRLQLTILQFPPSTKSDHALSECPFCSPQILTFCSPSQSNPFGAIFSKSYWANLFGPNRPHPLLADNFLPIQFCPIHFWPKSVFQFFHNLCGPKGGSRRGEGPRKVGAPKSGGAKISRFFSLPPQCSFFLLSWWSFVNYGVFEAFGVDTTWNFGGVF